MDFEIIKRSPVPVYLQLKDIIFNDIKNGKYTEGQQLPTVKELSAQSGVSIRTAYLALEELVKSGSCFKRPKKGIFVQKVQSEPEIQKVFGAWARYDVQSADYPIPKMFYAGLMSGCIQTGINPILFAENPAELIERYEQSSGFDFKGMAVLDLESYGPMLELAKKYPKKRFFFLNYRLESFEDLPDNVCAIINDDFGGAYRMVEHLAENGCRKFVIVSQITPVNDDITYSERIRGFKAAIRDLNLELKEIISLDSPTHIQKDVERKAFHAVESLLNHSDRPDAVCCVSDPTAEGARDAVRSSGINSVKVSGYDCMTPEIILNRDYPTVRVPYSEMALTAMKLVNSDFEPGQIITLAPEIVSHNNNTKEVITNA